MRSLKSGRYLPIPRAMGALLTEVVPADWRALGRSCRVRDRGVVEQIDAQLCDDPGPGGWSSGFANQAHWDPGRPRAWRCWAQTGPTWSAHCGAEVAAHDTLGLCSRHRHALLEGGPDLSAGAA